MSPLRRVHQYWKMVVIGFLMIVHGTIGNAARLVLSGSRLRRFQLELSRRNSRILLAVLGLEFRVEGEENFPAGACLAVSNHISYLDMVLFAAWRPFCFVSTVEVLRTPVLGQLATASGALFVERRSRENIRQEIGMIEGVLKEGFSSVFFPEGTSTDGHHVLPFKRPLFAPAQSAGVPVVPVVVQLEEVNGAPASPANRDLVCYYADMEFFPHLLALAGCSRVRMALKVLPAIPFAADAKREEIAAKAESMIREALRPI